MKRRSVIPESPEVSKMRDGLRPLVCGKQIATVDFYGRYAINKPDNFQFLEGLISLKSIVKSIDVKGKFMWWTLKQVDWEPTVETWYLFFTHGMSGGWTTSNSAKHPMMKITFTDGTKIIFNDQRHFATVNIVTQWGDLSVEKVLERRLKLLGPDILHSPITDVPEMMKRFKRKKHLNVCKALMDQSIVSGVGNYIKCEALWKACISPHRTVESLTDNELFNLICAAHTVATTSYAEGGATLANYTDVDGEDGAAQNFFNVYGLREDSAGEKVVKETTLDGRMTHWVPTRQR